MEAICGRNGRAGSVGKRLKQLLRRTGHGASSVDIMHAFFQLGEIYKLGAFANNRFPHRTERETLRAYWWHRSVGAKGRSTRGDGQAFDVAVNPLSARFGRRELACHILYGPPNVFRSRGCSFLPEPMRRADPPWNGRGKCIEALGELA